MVHLETLGGLALLDDRGRNVRLRSRKHLGLLTYLALGNSRTFDRSTLCHLFWATPESQARHSLSQAVYDLTQRLGSIVVRGPGASLSLDRSRVNSDVRQFEAALKAGNLGEAVELYQGPFAENLLAAGTDDFERWLEAERTRLSRLGEMALRKYVEACESKAQWGKMCVVALRLTQLAPLDEEVHRAFMKALWVQGDAASALRHFDSHAAFLEAELPGGVSAETKELVKRIRETPQPNTAISPEICLEPLFVGREAEFESLRKIVETIGSNTTKGVIVTGDAGIGKTRLVEELIRSLRVESVRVLESRCYLAERDHPYSSIIDGIKPLIAELGATINGLSKRLRRLAHLLPVDATQELGEAPGTNPAVWQHQLYDEVLLLVTLAGEDQPVVWCIDDVQWIDKASAALFHYLSRRLPGSQLLLVQTARLQASATGEPALTVEWPISTRNLNQYVPLGPLTNRQVRAILTHTRPEAQEHPVIDLAVRLSGGNPYYALEVLRAAVSSTEWARSATNWDPLNSEQLRSVLAVRLEGLGADRLRILQSMAVLARNARPRVVAALAGLDLSDTALLAEELYGRSILVDDEDRTIFTSDVMREYVYGQMSHLQKAAIHLSAGRALECETGISPGALATHFYLGDDWPRCFAYAMEAATSAQSSGGHAEAAHFAEIAGKVASGLDERRAALKTCGESLFALGDLDSSAGCYTKILSIAPPKSVLDRADILLCLAAVRLDACNWPAAAEVLPQAKSSIDFVKDSCAQNRRQAEYARLALKLAVRTDDKASVVGLASLLQGLVNDLELVAKPDPQTALSILMASAVHESLTGSGRIAVRRLATAQSYSRLTGPGQELRYLALRGLVRTRLAEWDAAEADFYEAQKIAIRLGDQVALVRLKNNLACVSLGMGRWDCADSRLGEAEAIQSGMSNQTDLSIPVALNRANLLFYQGFLAEAATNYATVESMCVDQHSPEYIPEILSCLGLVALQRGARSTAHDLWRRLIAVLPPGGSIGNQERFKVEWFLSAMQTDTTRESSLLVAAADEEKRDIPGHLKLLMLDAVLMCRSEARLGQVRGQLMARNMTWFSHVARRWHRMSALR